MTHDARFEYPALRIDQWHPIAFKLKPGLEMFRADLTMQGHELPDMVKSRCAYLSIAIAAKKIQMHLDNVLLANVAQNQPMRVWSFCIDSDDGDADERLGFVRAPTAQVALEYLGGSGASVYPCFDDVALPDGIGPFWDDAFPASVGGSDGSQTAQG